MTQRLTDRLYIAILLAALICGGLFGCSRTEALDNSGAASGDVSEQVEPNPLGELSRIQEAYLEKQGYPDLFAVNFESRPVKQTEAREQLNPTRRVDTWVYFGQPTRMVVFDDGFKVEDRDMDAGFKPKLKTGLKPTDFSSQLVQNDITTRYGNPDQQESASIEGKELTILTYQENAQEPTKTFGFVNNELVAVTIGFRFAGK